MKVRPLPGQVLIRVLPPEQTGKIVLPQVTLSAEERQQRSRNPEPPPPDIGIVEATGPWQQRGKAYVMPPVYVGQKVLVREGSGQKCTRNIGEKLKLVRNEDLLAVLS